MEDDQDNSYGLTGWRYRWRCFKSDGFLMVWRGDQTYRLCEKRWRSGEWQLIKRPQVGPERGISWLLLSGDGRSWALDAGSRGAAFRAAKSRINKEINWFEDIQFHLSQH